MNRHFLTSCCAGLLVLGGLGLVLAADDSKPINARCPISKEPTDGKTLVNYKDKLIGFCCPGCDKQFLAWSPERRDAYLTGLGARAQPDPEGDASPKPWSEPYSLGVCPVSGEKLGSMGDPLVKVYKGREVRFCCGGCLPKFEKEKAAHLEKVDRLIVRDQLRFYPLDTCVVTGKPLVVAGKDVARNVVLGYRLFRLASESAVSELQTHPKKYLAKLNQATAERQRPSYPLETCVVAGGELGSMGTPTEMVIAGRLLRFCCASCEPKVLANPAPVLAEVDKAWNEIGKYPLPTSRPRGK